MVVLNFYKTLTFRSYFLLFFMCFLFLFWEERDIKEEQKFKFTPIFNRDGLPKTNRANLRWVK